MEEAEGWGGGSREPKAGAEVKMAWKVQHGEHSKVDCNIVKS